MKKLLLSLALLLPVVLLSSCSNDDESGLSLNKSNIILYSEGT